MRLVAFVVLAVFAMALVGEAHWHRAYYRHYAVSSGWHSDYYCARDAARVRRDEVRAEMRQRNAELRERGETLRGEARNRAAEMRQRLRDRRNELREAARARRDEVRAWGFEPQSPEPLFP